MPKPRKRKRCRIQPIVDPDTEKAIERLSAKFDAKQGRILDACVRHIAENDVDISALIPRTRGWYLRKALREAGISDQQQQQPENNEDTEQGED